MRRAIARKPAHRFGDLYMVQCILRAAVLAPLVLGFGLAAHAEMPADCAAADAVVSGKIRALMRRSDVRATWLIGNSVAVVKQARAYCGGGQQEAALRQYGRLLLYMETQEAALAPSADSGRSADDVVEFADPAASRESQYDPW
jgi:hypothetical protein